MGFFEQRQGKKHFGASARAEQGHFYVHPDAILLHLRRNRYYDRSEVILIHF